MAFCASMSSLSFESPTALPPVALCTCSSANASPLFVIVETPASTPISRKALTAPPLSLESAFTAALIAVIASAVGIPFNVRAAIAAPSSSMLTPIDASAAPRPKDCESSSIVVLPPRTVAKNTSETLAASTPDSEYADTADERMSTAWVIDTEPATAAALACSRKGITCDSSKPLEIASYPPRRRSAMSCGVRRESSRNCSRSPEKPSPVSSRRVVILAKSRSKFAAS